MAALDLVQRNHPTANLLYARTNDFLRWWDGAGHMMFAESKDVRAQPHVQSVARAFLLLERLNQRAVSSVDELFRETGLAKPTIVRLLRTLIEEGYVSNDPRRGGYQVTSQVNCLSRGYHGDPLIVEAARPWAIALKGKRQDQETLFSQVRQSHLQKGYRVSRRETVQKAAGHDPPTTLEC